MKPTVFRYGVYSALTILALAAIHFFIVMPNASYETAEVAGYLTMILSMVFVFAGIRHYRDHVNHGSLSFVQGLKIGALIVLIPSVAFGLFDILYTQVINPSWLDDYFTHYAEKVRASAPPAELDIKLKKLEDDKAMFGNPVFQFLLMAGTVFIIGMIATVISALTLRRSRPVAIS